MSINNPFLRALPSTLFIVSLVTAIPLMLPSISVAQQVNAQGEPWEESAYGISLVPPAGSRLVEQPSNGAIAAWVMDEAKVTMTFDLVHSKQPVDLKTVAGVAQMQIGFAGNTATPIHIAAQRRIAERPGTLGLYRIENKRADDWIYGHAVMLIDPTTMAIFTMDAPLHLQEESRQWFTQMLESIAIPFADELGELRREQIIAGDIFLKSVTPEQMQEVLPEDQWFRLVEDGEDVGYMRCRWIHDEAALQSNGVAPPGLLLMVDRREVIGGRVVDTQFQSYASQDGNDEVWSKKSSVRGDTVVMQDKRLPGAHKDQAEAAYTWVESGVRGTELGVSDADRNRSRPRNFQPAMTATNIVTVTRESPPDSQVVQDVEKHERFSNRVAQRKRRPEIERWLGVDNDPSRPVSGSVKTRQWETPGVAFLSQARAWALPHLVQPEAPAMAFYAYHSGTGGLSLTTTRVVKEDDGGWSVYVRPSPRSGEIASRFSPKGELIQRRTPNGSVVIPTTKAELDRLWKIKQ